MINLIFEAFQFDFFLRAVAAGSILAILYAILGNFVVLRNEAIVGHSMANLAFLGVAIATLFSWNLYIPMIISTLLGVLFIHFFQSSSKINRDSVLALTSQISMAIAIITLSFVQGYQNIEGFLFGNILAVSRQDVWVTLIFSTLILMVVRLIHRSLLQTLINADLSQSNRVNTGRMNLIIMTALALSIVLGIKIIGVILLAAFLVIPANIAKNTASSLRMMFLSSVGYALFGAIAGLLLSYTLDTPSGAMIILVLGSILVLTHLLSLKKAN